MRWFSTIVIALVSGFAGAAAWDYSGLGARATRDHLLAHPEILPEAMEVLNERDMMARIDPMRDELETAYPGAVLGNPMGTVTMVEFSDYACGYCRQSLDDVEALIAANPELKIIVREYPILSEGSADAARMALAAADQGKFGAFHRAMFAKEGPSEDNINRAAQEAGLDLVAARARIEAGVYEGQLQNNVFLAKQTGFSGTPAWVIGDQAFNGAVGKDVLGQAIADAQES